MKVRMVR